MQERPVRAELANPDGWLFIALLVIGIATLFITLLAFGFMTLQDERATYLQVAACGGNVLVSGLCLLKLTRVI